jgi:hypothetical protein
MRKDSKMTTRKSLIALVCLCLFLTPASAIDWPTWDNDTPEPHTVFGEPIYTAHDPNHNITRKYEAFTVYYDDEVLSPRWARQPAGGHKEVVELLRKHGARK